MMEDGLTEKDADEDEEHEHLPGRRAGAGGCDRHEGRRVEKACALKTSSGGSSGQLGRKGRE